MAFLDWKTDYSVGVAIFDDEHKKLIAIINSLHDSILAEVDAATLCKISDAMVEYTIMHFRHEEMYFDDWAYPDAAEHILAHGALRQQVFDFRQRIGGTDSATLAEEMLSFLRQWLIEHILVEDRAYGEFLFDKGVR
ncbi:MAG: bacteriohemerythrin [Rhizomicrobium sp.]|nr:bacteriohemerythrin [Rhizomicrobium sp.]